MTASGLGHDIPWHLLLYWTAWLAMVAFVFLALGAAFAAVARKAETASRAGNCAALVCYLAAVAYDALSDHGVAVVARVLSPMRYWLPNDINEGTFSLPFGLLAAVLVVGGSVVAFRAFDRRDLTA